MAAKWMSSRQTKYAGYASVYTIVIIAVLALANFLANRYDKQFDATANKRYTLSDQTVRLVSKLNSPLNLTFFGRTEEFPQAKDLLDQYAALSSKVKVAMVDPVRKPQQAKSAGYRSDSPIIVESGARREGAKALTEEEVTGAIIRARKTGERNVCFLAAGGERSAEDTEGGGMSIAKQLVERDNYKTRTLALKGASLEEGKSVTVGQAANSAVEVPKDCNVLVVAGPQTSYSAATVTAIKNYVEGGGRALFMLDSPVQIGRSATPAENSELAAQLAAWGVTLNKDLVLDLSGVGSIFSLGPEIPLVMSYEPHAITSPMGRVPTAFPIVRSLDIKSGEKSTVMKLVDTSADSVAVDRVGAGGAIDPRTGKKGPLTLAAAGMLTGKDAGRFVVVGTSMWAQNSLMGSRSLANRDLFVNMVNWLSSDEDLISIRPKAVEDRPLNISGQKMNLIYWLSVVFFPLGVVGLGLATWWKRR